MKKIWVLLFFCQLNSLAGLFAQNDDSLSLEMQRLNRLGDSLHKVQQERDSAFREKLKESLRSAERSINDANQQQIEEATRQAVAHQENEQKDKRKTMWLAISAFVITVVIASKVFRRRRTGK